MTQWRKMKRTKRRMITSPPHQAAPHHLGGFPNVLIRWRYFHRYGLYPPWKRGDIGLSLSVCLSVCPSVCLSVPFDVGYFVHASYVWRSWARAFKFYTRINQGLKSCLVKVSSRSIDSGALKKLSILNFFFHMPSTLCRGVWSEANELELSNSIHV